jgi:hypothetical protein
MVRWQAVECFKIKNITQLNGKYTIYLLIPWVGNSVVECRIAAIQSSKSRSHRFDSGSALTSTAFFALLEAVPKPHLVYFLLRCTHGVVSVGV